MRKKSVKTDSQLDELRELVAETGADGGDSVVTKKTDRRNILRLAGAALLGAAGAAAVRAVPAAAADGDYMVLGSGTTNQATTTTFIQSNLAAGPTFQGGGTIALKGVGSAQGGTATSAEIGVLGTSKNGVGTGVEGSAAGGVGVKGIDTSGRGVYGAASTGSAVLGVANNGTYLGGGYDIQAGFLPPPGRNGGVVGTGRLAQIGRPDTGGPAPNWNPAFVVSTPNTTFFAHEIVRGYFGEIWASRFDTTSASRARWRRINTVRTDTADGSGAFYKPFRLIDTRSGAIKAPGSVTVVAVSGHGTGASAIPADAIAVMGNLTAAAYTGGGFLTIMPAGIVIGTAPGNYNPSSDPSSVNFITGQGAIANSFVCGLNGGSLQVYVGGPPLPGHSSHFIIDITAYLQ